MRGESLTVAHYVVERLRRKVAHEPNTLNRLGKVSEHFLYLDAGFRLIPFTDELLHGIKMPRLKSGKELFV